MHIIPAKWCHLDHNQVQYKGTGCCGWLHGFTNSLMKTAIHSPNKNCDYISFPNMTLYLRKVSKLICQKKKSRQPLPLRGLCAEPVTWVYNGGRYKREQLANKFKPTFRWLLYEASSIYIICANQHSQQRRQCCLCGLALSVPLNTEPHRNSLKLSIFWYFLYLTFFFSFLWIPCCINICSI